MVFCINFVHIRESFWILGGNLHLDLITLVQYEGNILVPDHECIDSLAFILIRREV